MVMQPRPQLLGAHPVDARSTGVALDASERLSEVPTGQEITPAGTRWRGERRCRSAPDRWCALPRRPRASPSDPPGQDPEGFGCGQRTDHGHERPNARLRVRPFPANIDPAGTTASADFSAASGVLSNTAVPHHPANRTGGASGTPAETSPDKTSNLHRAHPLRLRNGPLMDIGLRHVMLARPDRPALYAQPAAITTTTRNVFLGSRLRLRLPSHPASR
jgi:hypothetical protein